MGAEEILPAELESVLSFWAEVGVDYALEEAPQNRLAPRPVRERAAAPPAAAPIPTLLKLPPTPGEPPPAATGLADRSRDLAASATTLEALDASRAAFLQTWARPVTPLPTAGAPWRRGPSDAPFVVVTDVTCDTLEGGDLILRREEAALFAAMAGAAGLAQTMLMCALAPAPSTDRAPDLDGLSLFHPFVVRLLELVQPGFILILGAGAAQALGPSLTLQEGQRSLARIDLSSGPTPALITLHPRFLLRQPLGKKRVWADLLTVKAGLNPL